MTNKEKATALMGIMGDEGRAWSERIAAQAELNALKKAAKVGWEKLGVTEKWLAWFEESQGRQHDALPDAASLSKSAEELAAGDPKEEKAQEALEQAGPDPLDEPTPQEDKAAIVEAVKQGEPLPMGAVVRGLISAEVRRLLLDTPSTYAEIEAAVRAKYPEAKTTTRSIASVASDMRRAGKPVPQRRKEASK